MLQRHCSFDYLISMQSECETDVVEPRQCKDEIATDSELLKAERVHFKSPFNVSHLQNDLVRPSFKVLALYQGSYLEER